MKPSSKVDRISVLPKNMIDSILVRLPILEAVRTSILSQSWRYHWHSLSKINLYFSNPRVSQVACVNIIDHILLVHYGSVDKFQLVIFIELCYDMDPWILYLSRNGIKELIINKMVGRRINIPSCLFSCSGLMHLKLTNCTFKPPLAAFKAFCNLTDLYFAQVEINDNELSNLLNLCPLLRRLSLLSVHPCPSLKINGPNLLMFHVVEFNSYSQFKNTPILNSATFGLSSPVSSRIANDKDCKIVEFFRSMPILQILEFEDHALQHLAVGDVPVCLPFVCLIKHLIMNIDFEDLQELLAAFCIFRSSPIQILDITACWDKHTRKSADGFWEGGQEFEFKFDHLQKVEVCRLTGTESELKFIEFLLANAPTLKTVEIWFGALDKDLLLTIVKKLTRFPRVSPNAELELFYYV